MPEKYKLCSVASTARLLMIRLNINEATQVWEPDASTFLTAALLEPENTERIYCCSTYSIDYMLKSGRCNRLCAIQLLRLLYYFELILK